MSMAVRSERDVAEVTVMGRLMRVHRTDWTNSDGLSFDVIDKASGLCLTPESLDEQPDADEIDDIVAGLVDDYDNGSLDPFYVPDDERVAAFVEAVCPHDEDQQYVDTNTFRFRCRTCGADLGR